MGRLDPHPVLALPDEALPKVIPIPAVGAAGIVGGSVGARPVECALLQRVFAVVEEVGLSSITVSGPRLHAPETGAWNARVLGTITQDLGKR
ncbi:MULTISPECIES: hypothetical protein [unclassified Aureimonas]|uniref:hypothetical protein n=1 Tax=unclassified Aureimonas TaxID=2615206 RepID=UPI0012E3488C|nr:MULTISPECIES: hypothetical protein [unclassified Aureimonas]